MTLTEIIKAAAERMQDVSVDIDRCMGFVSISSDGEEDITFQGDEADQFIEAVDKLYNESGHVTEDEAALCHAQSYVECIWG